MPRRSTPRHEEAKSDGSARHVGKQIRLLLRRPDLQLGARFRPHVDAQTSSAPSRHLDAANVPSVAAVQSVGHAQDGRESAHDVALLRREQLKLLVPVLRNRAAVVPRDSRDQLAFAIGKARQVGVIQQVVRVLVMPVVRHERAHVVQHGCRVQQRALLGAEAVHAPRLVEQGKAELGDLLRVRFAVRAAPPERAQSLEHHVLPVQAARRSADLAPDQIGHQAVAQAARGDLHLFDAQPAHHAVQDGRPGVHDVDARFVDAELAALLGGAVAKPLENPAHLRLRDGAAAARWRSRDPPRQRRDGARGPSRADQAAVAADEQRIDLPQTVLDRFLEETCLAGRDGIALDEELRQTN